MSKIHVITTEEDLSIGLLEKAIRENHEFKLSYFGEQEHEIDDDDVLYLRDPFNTGRPLEEVRTTIEKIFQKLSASKNIKVIDNLEKTEDIFFEDKWRQYQVFRDYMPKTTIYDQEEGEPINGSELIKERISSRSKGIYFSSEKLPHSESGYIIQDKLDIQTEYRVMIVAGNVLPLAGIKRSKAEYNKLAVTDATEVSSELKQFTMVLTKLAEESGINYEMIGLDIAKTTSGSLYLIEYNRSPQFNAYTKLTQTNPAKLLF
ncbi:MAG: hypothetical protein ACOCXP_00060 [Candidatus Dojkabacteria bacterium]